MPFKKLESQSLDSIHSMRVVDLREALRARNLSASGNKAALCERLYKAMQDDDAKAKANPAVPHEEAPNSGMQSCGSKIVAKYLEEQKVALMKARKAADLARAASSSEMASEESKAVLEYEGKLDVSTPASARGRRGKMQQKEASADVESVKLTRVLRTRKSALTSTAVDCSGQETVVVAGEAAEKQTLELENSNQSVTSSEEKKAPASKRLAGCEKDQDEDVFVEKEKTVDDQFEDKNFADEVGKEQHFLLGSFVEERRRKPTEDYSICTEIASDSDVNLPAAADAADTAASIEKLTENVSVEVDQGNRLALSKDTVKDESEQTNIADDAIAESVVNRLTRVETSTKDNSSKHTNVEILQELSSSSSSSSVDKEAYSSPAIIESFSSTQTSPPSKRISVSGFAISVEEEVLDYGDDSFDDDHSHVTAITGTVEIEEKKLSKLTHSDNTEPSSQCLESELSPAKHRNEKEVSKCIADPVSYAEERQRKSSICHLPDGELLTNVVQKDEEIKSEVVQNADVKSDESANKIEINPSWDADLISAINKRRNVSPARRECSPVIYVRCLTRPYAIPALHNILGSFGSYSKKNFWINSIKSSCLVKYDDIESAVKARDALHNIRWPASNPKTLHVDFSTTEELESLLATVESEETSEEVLVSAVPVVVGEVMVAAQKLAQLFQRTTTKPSLYYLPLTSEQAEMRIDERKQRRQFRLKAMEEVVKKTTKVANKAMSQEEKLSMVVDEQSEKRNEGNEMSKNTVLMRIAMPDITSRRRGGFYSERSPAYEIENWRRRPNLRIPSMREELSDEERHHSSEDTKIESRKNAEKLALTKLAVAEGGTEKSFRSENSFLKRRWSNGSSRSSSAEDGSKRRAAADGVDASESGDSGSGGRGGRHQRSSKKGFSTSSAYTNSSSPTSVTSSSSLSSSATSSSSSSSRPSSSSVVSVSLNSSSVTSTNSKINANRKYDSSKSKDSDRVKRSTKRGDSREKNSRLERAKKNDVVVRRSTHAHHRDWRFDEHASRSSRHDSRDRGPREREQFHRN
ncbi:Apoptotic chromatin condensation inducer in the nucleus [Trichinella pseudospiralis]|uniref:Apoptotic chromatin condensation inducer in the nucleus n=1 Tax=Trichinella pseudospiralis TaxID=6337 RepID=A0A0V1FQT0_TRIPS|nr:Apoptotic chromatin condensation inducer in the nucleus [Trichinella pseudospiralis]